MLLKNAPADAINALIHNKLLLRKCRMIQVSWLSLLCLRKQMEATGWGKEEDPRSAAAAAIAATAAIAAMTAVAALAAAVAIAASRAAAVVTSAAVHVAAIVAIAAHAAAIVAVRNRRTHHKILKQSIHWSLEPMLDQSITKYNNPLPENSFKVAEPYSCCWWNNFFIAKIFWTK